MYTVFATDEKFLIAWLFCEGKSVVYFVRAAS